MEKNYGHIYSQPQKNGKKLTALAVAIALAATGGCAATKYLGKDKAPVEEVPTNELTTTVYDPLVDLMYITEDFDINDDEAVTKRAMLILQLAEREFDLGKVKDFNVTELDIKNLIYITNEKLDKVVYPENLKTDAKKFKYAQELLLMYGKLFDDSTKEFVGMTDIIVEDSVKTEEETTESLYKDDLVRSIPCAYMFMAETNEGKKMAIEVAKVNYRHLLNIKAEDLTAMLITSQEYYKLYTEAKELKMSDGYEMTLFKNFSATNGLYSRMLDDKQVLELDTALGFIATSANAVFTELTRDLDISKIIKDGNFSNTTPLKEQYKSENKVEAEQRPEAWSPEEEKTTKIVEQGGKPITTQKVTEPASNNKVPATTRTETTTFIVPVTEYTTEKFVPGGEVISEWYNDDQAIDAEELAKQFEDDEQLKGDPTYTK